MPTLIYYLTGILLAFALDYWLLRKAQQYFHTRQELTKPRYGGVFLFGQFLPLLTWTKIKLSPLARLFSRVGQLLLQTSKTLPLVLWAWLRLVWARLRSYWPRLVSFLKRLGPALFWLGCGLVSASFVLRLKGIGAAWLPWLSLGAGVLLVGIRVSRQPIGLPDELAGNLQSRPRIRTWQLFLMLASPVLAWIAWLGTGSEGYMKQPVLALVAWLGGVGLILLAGYQPLRHSLTSAGFSKKFILTASLLVLAAFLIRFIGVSTHPGVVAGDEGGVGLNAVEFLKGRTDNIFRPGFCSYASLYFFIQSIPIALFGQTVLALRVTSTVVGALTVGALYWMAREMFAERTALFSALFLAVLHFHNHFSRLGLQNVWDGFWYVVVLGMLWVGWRKGARLPFVLSGLSLGLAQYFYASARLLLMLVPAWIVLAGALDRERLRHNLPNLGYLLLGAFVAVLPLAAFYLGHPDEYMAPFNRVGLDGAWLANTASARGLQPWQVIIQQLVTSFQGYFLLPVKGFYGAGVPVLRPLPAMVFFVGLGVLLARPRDDRTDLLSLWLLAFGVTGAMSAETPAAQRLVATAPALALVVGVGLAALQQQISRLRLDRPRLGIVVLLLAAVLFADELRFYFLEYDPYSFEFGGANTVRAIRLADYLQDKDDRWEVLFFGAPHMDYRSIPALPFLAPQIKGIDIKFAWNSAENPLPDYDHLIFVFLPHRQDDLPRVRTSYPGGKLTMVTEHGELLYYLYEVEKSP